MRNRLEKNYGLLVSAVIGLGVMACGKKTPTVVQLKPAALAYSVVSITHDRSHKGGLSGDAMLDRKPDEVLAGFERFYDGSRNLQFVYRGGVRFDLTPISGLKSKVVNKATLHFVMRGSYVRDNGGKAPEFVNLTSCARSLLLASEDWTKLPTADGHVTQHLPAEEVVMSLPAATPGAAAFALDVTRQTRNWVVSPDQNLGFVLKGFDEERTPAQNNACASRYGDFSLEVDYTAFEL